MAALTNSWIFWSLLSAFFAGLTAISAKVGVSDINPNLATALRTTVVVVLTWLLAANVVSRAALAAVPGRTWLFLVLSGLATGLSWICYFRAMKLGNASQVAPVDKISIVFVIILAAVFLRESVILAQWIGGGLILAGAVIMARYS
jgi:bacterial/archaeal transporter family protein